VCDYDDPAAREALGDALARGAMALLVVLQGRELVAAVSQPGALLVTVVATLYDNVEQPLWSGTAGEIDYAGREARRTSGRGGLESGSFSPRASTPQTTGSSARRMPCSRTVAIAVHQPMPNSRVGSDRPPPPDAFSGGRAWRLP
jgi:hypothetical protein